MTSHLKTEPEDAAPVSEKSVGSQTTRDARLVRDVNQPRLSMYALRKIGIPPANTWPPICGHYEKAWVVPGNNGPSIKRWVPIMIRYEPSRDPETGEVLDRSSLFQCWIDGRESRIEYAWPECSGRPITEAAYLELLASRDADDGYNPMEESL